LTSRRDGATRRPALVARERPGQTTWRRSAHQPIPIRHAIKRAVISLVGSPLAQSAPRSGGVPVRVARHALSVNGSVAKQPDTITEEGSDNHNPDPHQNPRTHQRRTPRRGTPPSPRPGPTRRCHPPRTGPFQAAAHPRIARSKVGPKSNGAAHGRPVPLHPYAQPEGVGGLDGRPPLPQRQYEGDGAVRYRARSDESSFGEEIRALELAPGRSRNQERRDACWSAFGVAHVIAWPTKFPLATASLSQVPRTRRSDQRAAVLDADGIGEQLHLLF
jgi:hypothetical protein